MAIHKSKPKGKSKPKSKSRYRAVAPAGSSARRSNPRRRQSKRDAERVLRRGPIRRRPKDQPLPGMEDARIRELDNICGSISDTRAQQANLRAEEAGLEQTALHLMRKHNKTAWRAHGVELVRVPGEEKLRVRTSRDTATAETEPEDTGTGKDIPPVSDALHAMDGEDDGDRDAFDDEAIQ